MNRATSTQPGVDPTLRIYGSRKVIPLDSSNQPEVLANTKVYGNKHLPTVQVKFKDGSKELTINENDFDADRHVRLDRL